MINRKIVFICAIPIICIALIILIYKIYGVLPLHIKYYNKINIGTKIIKEIDNYYGINKKYPTGSDFTIIENIYRKTFLKENIEFDESIQPLYFSDGNEYMIVYASGFDGPDLFYYSKTKEWQYSHAYVPIILYKK
jgi:hypothetical protein